MRPHGHRRCCKRTLAAETVAALYRDAGLSRPVQDLARLQRMPDGANLTVSAWDGVRAVGPVRALTDFSYCCYVADPAVASAYRRQGIGRSLPARVTAQAGDECALILLAAASARTYYRHLGFSPVDRAWRLPRRR